MQPARSLAKCFDGMGRVIRNLRLGLLRLEVEGQTDRPNTPDEWASIYASKQEPVRALSSIVAQTVASLTAPGDVLLEAGCGYGGLSAELAISGREIVLCDFSRSILDRARALFELSGLPEPKVMLADLTKRLPWPDNAVDCVWSSGVLEHWTDEEMQPIVAEMARVSRKSVISLIPNARSIWYRFGKYLAEQSGLWAYGRELPRATLRGIFAAAGLIDIREFTIWPDHVTGFLRPTDPKIAALADEWWRALEPNDPVKENQGYLLVTVGHKRAQA